MFALTISLLTSLLVIASSAFVPYITRKTEAFGVSIPSKHSNDPVIAALRARYRNTMLAWGILPIALPTICYCYTGFDPNATLIGLGFGLTPYLIAVFAVYLPKHSQMKKIKAESAWKDEPAAAVITASTSPASKDTIHPAWLILLPATLCIGLAVTALIWPQLPQTIPIHFDAAGIADSFVPKGPMALAAVLVPELFLIVVITICFFLIRRARRQIDAATPVESLEQDKRFRRYNSIFLVSLGVGLVAILSAMQIMTFLGVPTSYSVILPTVLLLVGIGVGLFVIMLKVGQGGSRLRVNATGSDAVNYDDDRYWKLGQFYFNRDDPAVFVEKRFGIGWTCNLARPTTWALASGLVLLTVGLLIFAAFVH